MSFSVNESEWSEIIELGFKVAQRMFSIFLGARDSGNEHILSEFAHSTKLWGAISMLEGRDAIQKDLDRPEGWHLLELNKALSYTWVRAIPGSQTGWAEKWLRGALQRRTGGWWLMKNSTWASSLLSQPRKPMGSWAASKEAWAEG